MHSKNISITLFFFFSVSKLWNSSIQTKLFTETSRVTTSCWEWMALSN